MRSPVWRRGRDLPAGDPARGGPDPLVDLTARLMDEFQAQLQLVVIARVIASCRRDLGWPANPPTPAAVERLARDRLQALTAVFAPRRPGPGS